MQKDGRLVDWEADKPVGAHVQSGQMEINSQNRINRVYQRSFTLGFNNVISEEHLNIHGSVPKVTSCYRLLPSEGTRQVGAGQRGSGCQSPVSKSHWQHMMRPYGLLTKPTCVQTERDPDIWTGKT